MEISKCLLLGGRYIKPGFHMIVLIAPVVSKNFKMIQTTGTIGGFLVIAQVIASTARDTGSSAMSLGQTKEFLHGFCKQAKHTGTCNDGF